MSHPDCFWKGGFIFTEVNGPEPGKVTVGLDVRYEARGARDQEAGVWRFGDYGLVMVVRGISS